MLEVAAGLVFRHGTLLITQRPAGSHLGGLWEFPGGKRHADETFEACLARELAEELGIEARIGACLHHVEHDYGDRRIFIRFFRCDWVRHEPQPLGCPAFAWVKAEDLGGYAFPAADATLVDRLRRSPELWGLAPAS
jgi:mutator protein MutT